MSSQVKSSQVKSSRQNPHKGLGPAPGAKVAHYLGVNTIASVLCFKMLASAPTKDRRDPEGRTRVNEWIVSFFID
jgi:hypothetical protein